MKPTRTLTLFIALWLGFASTAHAGFTDLGTQGSNPADNYLPADQAFVLQPAQRTANHIEVSWEIAPGYYLYRHSLRFKPMGRVTLGTALLPAGVTKHDEYFGEVQTYHQQLIATLPVGTLPNDQPLSLEVRYQGCADQGLCYPPVTRQLEIAALTATSSARPSQTDATVTATNIETGLAERLSQGNSLWALFQFFGLGILLAFTPCVLPMLPILASVIAGSHAKNSQQGFFLSIAYVLAMASAYTLFGVIAGLFGQNLQAILQAPVALYSFSAVFLLLAGAMFGLYELALPSRLQNALSALSARQKGGTYAGAAIMGFLGALIAGPCIAPPLAGALLYIGQTGDPWLGGLALFCLGLGMGVPLVLFGSFEGRLLPRAGLWMQRINQAFGFLMIGLAIWLSSRALSPPWPMLAWAALAYGVSVYLLSIPQPSSNSLRRKIFMVLGLLVASYGAMLTVGALSGAQDPLRPVALTTKSSPPRTLAFQPISDLTELQQVLSTTREPVVLDFYADWCVACRNLERDIIPNPDVQAALSQFTRLRIDLTQYTDADRQLLAQWQLAGPPALLFFHHGKELSALRQLGEPNAKQLTLRLQQVLATTSPTP